MNLKIGELSRLTGVPTKTIRYYEESGLISEARRLPNGYRIYSQKEAHLLAFVKRARDLGFSVEEAGRLLALWQNKRRKSEQVRKLADEHLFAIDKKIAALQDMKNNLKHLVQCCHGDERPECPILDRLADVDFPT